MLLKIKCMLVSLKTHLFSTRRGFFLILLGTFIGVAAIHLWTLMRVPAPFVDEAWNCSRAWGFLQTGRNVGALDAGLYEQFDAYWTIFPIIQTLLHVTALIFCDFPALFPLRLVTFLWGLILLLAVLKISHVQHGSRFAIISVLICALSTSFTYSSHLVRPDIIAAAFGFTAIAIYFNCRSDRFWKGLFTGLLLGLALEIHPFATIFIPTLGVMIICDHKLTFLRQKLFRGIICGGLIGVGFYAAVHILPNPNTYIGLNKILFSSTHTPPLLSLNPKIIGPSFYKLIKLMIQFELKWLPFIIWTAVIFLLKRTRPNFRFFLLFMLLFFSFGFLVQNKLAYYAILMMPALYLFIADLLYQGYGDHISNRYYTVKLFLWMIVYMQMILDYSILYSIILSAAWFLIVYQQLEPDKRTAHFLYGIVYLGGLVCWNALGNVHLGLYVVIIIPILDVILTYFCERLVGMTPLQTIADRIVFSVGLCFFIGGLISNLSFFQLDYSSDYTNSQNRINRVVHPGDTIIGSQTYWFGLYDHPYYSWEKLAYYKRFYPTSSLADAFNAFRPDILIIDNHLRQFIIHRKEKSKWSYGKHLALEADELGAVIAHRGKLLDQFDGGGYGTVQIFRLNFR